MALPLLAAVLGFIALVSLWTPLEFERIAERWFSIPNIFYLWPVPLLTALLAYWAYRGIVTGRDLVPFACTIGLFLLSFAGLAISTYPYLVPPVAGGEEITVWQASAAPESQIFMLIGTLIMMPLILTYTVLVYWTFRGKVRPGEGYH